MRFQVKLSFQIIASNTATDTSIPKKVMMLTRPPSDRTVNIAAPDTPNTLAPYAAPRPANGMTPTSQYPAR